MRYEYVRVGADTNKLRASAYMESHRKIIDQKAAEGARYVGWFPVRQTSSGKTLEFDLIFEVE